MDHDVYRHPPHGREGGEEPHGVLGRVAEDVLPLADHNEGLKRVKECGIGTWTLARGHWHVGIEMWLLTREHWHMGIGTWALARGH
jgi:hypothetical protein